jgi:hypothetical protein
MAAFECREGLDSIFRLRSKVCTPTEPLTDAEKLAIAAIAAEFREYLE